MYTKKTLLDLKQSLADKHDSGILPTSSATLSFWTRLFNAGQDYCASKLRPIKSVSLTTVSGTVALPDDFLFPIRVKDSDNVELPILNREDQDSVGTSAPASCYWIDGNHFDGFTFNTSTDETYTMYYAYKVSEMSSNTDVCIIQDPEAVVFYAYSKLRKSETDPLEDADAAMGECERRIDIMVSDDQMRNTQITMNTL